jgi:hypothetical protein
MLLNHDIAFLAEVMLDFAGAQLTAPAYQSLNCFALPKASGEIPPVMRYAAAITIALAHFRVADHRADARSRAGRWAWSFAARVLSPRYRAAARDLRALEFPLDEMAATLESQLEREARATSLEQVTEPTIRATAMVFAHGVRIGGRDDRIEYATELGAKFGELIYLLDAYEDRARDAQSGAFNPLRSLADADAARRRILALTAEIAPFVTPAHAARLRANVEERLGLRPRVLHQRCRRTLRQRAHEAWGFAQMLRQREHAGLLKGAAIVASVAGLAFIFPDHARRTGSWRECLTLPLNLMALGAVFAAPLKPDDLQPFQPDAPQKAAACGCGGCDGCGDCCGDCCCQAICEGICDMFG